MATISSVSLLAAPSFTDRLTAFATQGTTSTLASASGDTSATSLQVAAVQTPDITNILYRQQLAQAAISHDTKALADTITDVFQSIMAARPDLADAQFDFVSSQGGIKVVSSTMSRADKQWLEDQLNANQGLVDAVNGFNTDLGTLLKANAAVDAAKDPSSQQVSAAQAKAKIDGTVHFLSLMQSVAYEASKTGWDRDATYTDTQGRPIDLAGARTTSLAGMIDAKRQLDALQDGAIVTRLKDGRVIYAAVTQSKDGKVVYPPPGTPTDPYAMAAILAPAFVPGLASASALLSGARGRWSIAWHDRRCFHARLRLASGRMMRSSGKGTRCP
jgi:hypothetical protein